MKLLAINPNTSEDFTQRVYETIKTYAAPTTQFKAVNSKSGPRSIESIYDAILSSPGTLEIVIEEGKDYDAFLMACYADHPVIAAVREITNKPVLGIAEASMHMACMLGHRFSIVTSTDSWVPILSDHVKNFGLSDRCASIRAVGLPILSAEAAGRANAFASISQTCKDVLEQDGAEVICLGSAGMTGMDREIQQELGIPVLDGVACALKFLEGMVDYGVTISKRVTYATPYDKEQSNISPIFREPYKRSG